MIEIGGIKIWGHAEQQTIDQMRSVLEYEKQGIPRPSYCNLLADNHLGYSVPVGGVVAYEGAICVNGVGYDIACGNKAVRLNVSSRSVMEDIYRIMNDIQKHISFGVGRKNNEKVDHDLFDDTIWDEIPFLLDLKDKAMHQLGTVGSGNHYVDLFVDEFDRVWCGVHFGSRGLGHSIASHFIKLAGGKDGVNAEPVLFSDQSESGQTYLRCMELAGRYAYAGRDWVCSRVAQLLKSDIVEEVHNHHNFAWKEHHFGRDLWVIRKGSTPAFPGQKGFVGGSMGDISVILEGMSGEASMATLYSTVHGAGRVLGRSAAKGKRGKDGNYIRQPLVSRAEMGAWIDSRGVEVRGGDVDEAPQCYRRLPEVLKAHEGTIKILHTLKPIGVCMADSRDKDPYSD